MTRQAELAIREADVIIFVVDVTDGVTAPDLEVAELLRRHAQAGHRRRQQGGEPEAGGRGAGVLGPGLEPLITSPPSTAWAPATCWTLSSPPFPTLSEPEPEEGGPVRVAVIGRPNVGKSSLVNAILGEERVIVSDVPGTTRDAIDVLVERGEDKFLLIDTAGMRRKARVEEAVERYSVMRALRAVERAQVVLIVIDAQDGVTEQDQRIAGYAHENGKACIAAWSTSGT